MTSRFEYEGHEFDKVSDIRLISQLEKVQDEWKILSLEAIYIRDRLVPTAPLPPDAVPSFEGVDKFRKSYRYGTWLLTTTVGLTVSDSLPGEDDPESVTKVLDKNRAWINSQ